MSDGHKFKVGNRVVYCNEISAITFMSRIKNRPGTITKILKSRSKNGMVYNCYMVLFDDAIVEDTTVYEQELELEGPKIGEQLELFGVDCY